MTAALCHKCWQKQPCGSLAETDRDSLRGYSAGWEGLQKFASADAAQSHRRGASDTVPLAGMKKTLCICLVCLAEDVLAKELVKLENGAESELVADINVPIHSMMTAWRCAGQH